MVNNQILTFKFHNDIWNNMITPELNSPLVLTFILLALISYLVNANSSILASPDEPTCCLYDMDVAEAEKATFTSGSNQTFDENISGVQR
jgi:hypothetical protein